MRSPSLARTIYDWSSQFADPVRFVRGIRGLAWYFRDYRAYRRAPGAEAMGWRDLRPALHDHSATHEVDAHYFYVNAWAIRRITAVSPRRHVDIASQLVFVSLASATIPIIYLDYRPLRVRLSGLRVVSGNLVGLPFRDGSIESLSCLHVAEHVGLGRYGDPLDPLGTRKTAAELTRVLAPGGHLFFAIPVGRQRVAFNAHRIHAPATIIDYFRGLALVELSGVDDAGRYRERVDAEELAGHEYACGFFWFRKV